jgi:hypothetical protein
MSIKDKIMSMIKRPKKGSTSEKSRDSLRDIHP